MWVKELIVNFHGIVHHQGRTDIFGLSNRWLQKFNNAKQQKLMTSITLIDCLKSLYHCDKD